jgi:anti-sigma regulatory factor (Ser/Thr protein kinase)
MPAPRLSVIPQPPDDGPAVVVTPARPAMRAGPDQSNEECEPACGPAPGDGWSFSRAYPGVPEQIGKARRDVARLLDGCPAEANVVLCLSEIASNAILHSRSGQPGGHFGVQLEARTGESVRVAVDDDGGPWAASRADDDIAHGHGLEIVRALSSEMGIDGDGPRRMVWFRCLWQKV